MSCKILLRAGWKNIFCIPDSENVSPAGEGSDWVKEAHCYKSGIEFFWFYDFLFFILVFIIPYVLNRFFRTAK